MEVLWTRRDPERLSRVALVSMKRIASSWLWLCVLLLGAWSCFPDEAPDGAPTVSSLGGRAAVSGGTSASAPEGGSSQGGASQGGNEEPGEAGQPGSAGEPPAPRNGKCVGPVASPEAIAARAGVVSGAPPAELREVFVSQLFEQFKAASCGACHVSSQQAPSWGPAISEGNFAQYVGSSVLERLRSNDTTRVMPPISYDQKVWSQRVEGDPIYELAEQIELWLGQGAPTDVYYVPGEQTASYVLSREVGLGLTNIGNCIPEPDFPIGSYEADVTDKDALFTSLGRVAKAPGVSGEQQLGLPASLAETDLTSLDSDVLARYGVVAYAPTYPLWSDNAKKLRHVRVPRGQSIQFDKARQTFEIPENTRFYKTFLKAVVDQEGNPRYRKMETRVIVARRETLDAAGNRVQNALFGTYKWDETETEAKLVTLAQNNGEPFKDEIVPYITDEKKAQQIRDQNPANLTYELMDAGAMRHYAIPGRQRCVQCHMGQSSFVLGFLPLQLQRRPEGEGGVIEATGTDELNQLQRMLDLGIVTGLDSPNDVLPLEESQLPRKPRNQQELAAQGYLLGNCAHCHNPTGYPSSISPEMKVALDFLPSAEGGVFEFPLERYSDRITRGSVDPVRIPYITPSLRDLTPAYFGTLLASNWRPKYDRVAVDPQGQTYVTSFFDAPWRSLIFRNVHTPFSYSDDDTIFPHMPLHTSGYDCRAPRVLGEWMVSIPARRKQAALSENYSAAYNDPDNPGTGYSGWDHEPQPYVEVKPSEAGYAEAVRQADGRLEKFRSDLPYHECISDRDILDPDIRDSAATPADGDTDKMLDNVPDRFHWVSTDLTEPPGVWAPRRLDWAAVLVQGQQQAGTTAAQRAVVRDLQSVQLSPAIRTFASKPFPLALWKQKEGCQFRSAKKLSAYSPPLDWMKAALGADAASANAPVFEATPGQIVFDMVCTNCHGREADSRGRMAETLQTFTGGTARVANLRDGLFDISSTPPNRQRVFGTAANGSVTTDDWAARYMVWMGMGGTLVNIPAPLLDLVGRTDVAGAQRKQKLGAAVGANMLAVVEAACREVLPYSYFVPFTDSFAPRSMSLIDKNGDAEFWEALCSVDNPSPVRGLDATGGKLSVKDTYTRASYPATARVGNQRGVLETGVGSDNLLPWCVLRPQTENPQDIANFEAFLVSRAIQGEPLPVCPTGLTVLPITADAPELPSRESWARRGAINAGLLVYLYLDQFTRGQLRPIRYNECELLPP